MEQQTTALLKVADVAERLGLSRTSIYRLIYAGDLKPVKIGRSIRFRPADVNRFIEALGEQI
jgi:excisionase family DNA binding protein